MKVDPGLLILLRDGLLIDLSNLWKVNLFLASMLDLMSRVGFLDWSFSEIQSRKSLVLWFNSTVVLSVDLYYVLVEQRGAASEKLADRRLMSCLKLFAGVLDDGLFTLSSQRNHATFIVGTVTRSLTGYLLKFSKVYTGEDLHYDRNGLDLTSSLSDGRDACSARDGLFRSGDLLMESVDFMLFIRISVKFYFSFRPIEDGYIFRTLLSGFKSHDGFVCKVFDNCTDSIKDFLEKRQVLDVIAVVRVLVCTDLRLQIGDIKDKCIVAGRLSLPEDFDKNHNEGKLFVVWHWSEVDVVVLGAVELSPLNNKHLVSLATKAMFMVVMSRAGCCWWVDWLLLEQLVSFFVLIYVEVNSGKEARHVMSFMSGDHHGGKTDVGRGIAIDIELGVNRVCNALLGNWRCLVLCNVTGLQASRQWFLDWFFEDRHWMRLGSVRTGLLKIMGLKIDIFYGKRAAPKRARCNGANVTVDRFGWFKDWMRTLFAGHVWMLRKRISTGYEGSLRRDHLIASGNLNRMCSICL